MPTINVCPGSAHELQDIADTLGKSRKVIVVTGAGISTNCGIPDFRSENGLYSLIQAQYDAALQNPPWEKTDNYDIDDRPKKKRRVTDRWYYELVPIASAPVQDTNGQPLEEQETRSPRSQFASRTTTSRSTPAAQPNPDSSPLSSARSISPPPPSEDFKIVDSSILPQHTRSSLAALGSSSSRSLRSRTSRSSSVFTTDDASRENLSQSDSSTPSFSAKTDDIAIASESEQDSQIQSSSASTTSEESPKDVPQLSQSSSTRTLPNLKGRDLFDSMIWSDPFTTSIFYMFISSLRDKIKNGVSSTTSTHRFLRVLRDGGRLVRNYTQNIDCLEEREGLCTELSSGPGNRARFHSRTQREVRPDVVGADSAHNGGVEVVLLHGSLNSLRCGICAKLCSWELENRESATLSGTAPDCPHCTEYNAKRTNRGRRGLAVGRLRPDIVLYGEEHPHANLIAPLITHDLSLGPDFLLIMGTSLKVHGLKVMVKEFAKAVHIRGGKVVFVNRTKPPESTWGEFIDYWVEWDCDEWVEDLEERRGDIWLPQGSQVESINRRESSGDTKTQTRKPSQTSRPQAVRDDKLNGVYHTFKILDTLGQIRDSSGATATRPTYWDKPLRTVVTTIRAESSKQPRKSLPAPKTSAKEGNAKKRKSYPSALEEKKSTAVVADMWENLRKIAPGLNPTPPASSRIALTELHQNRGFPINYIFHRSFPINHFPNIGGYSLGKIDLITHPPFGADVPIHTPKSVPKPAVERKPITHSYGTRASARLSGISAETGILAESTILVNQTPVRSSCNPTEDTIVVTTSPSQLSPPSTENTIVVNNTLPPFSRSPTADAIIVADPPSSQPLLSSRRSSTADAIIVSSTPTLPPLPSRSSTEDAIIVATPQAEDGKPPTPPTSSDPITPSVERIKRLGSIESLLSSPGESGCSSATTVYHDAQEY